MEAPAGRPPRSFKWLVAGCGGLLIVGLLGIGVVTIILYVVNKRASEIADVGAEYLRQEPRRTDSLMRIEQEFGQMSMKI